MVGTYLLISRGQLEYMDDTGLVTNRGRLEKIVGTDLLMSTVYHWERCTYIKGNIIDREQLAMLYMDGYNSIISRDNWYR